MNHKIVFSIALVLLLVGAAPSLRGQQSTGSVNGTVRDASGAVVANASIVLSNDATSVQRTIESNGSGVYVFSNVLPGTYTLTARKDGFDTVNRTNSCSKILF